MNPTPRAIEIMRGTAPFDVLSAERLAELIRASYGVKYQAGEDILFEGESSHKLGVILSGEAQVFKGAGEGRVLMSVLAPGSVIGAAGLFSEESAATGIHAKRGAAVLWIGERAMEELMQSDFVFTRRYIGYLTSRIRFLTERIENIACSGAQEKLYGFLVRNSQNGVVKLAVGMGELAEALSISRASLYRVMDELISAGRIRRDGKTIYIK